MFHVPATTSPMYEFVVPGSKKVHKIPAASAMPYDTALSLAKLSGKNDVEVVEVFVAFVDRYAQGSLDGLSMAQVLAIIQDYTHNGESLGE